MPIEGESFHSDSFFFVSNWSVGEGFIRNSLNISSGDPARFTTWLLFTPASRCLYFLKIALGQE
jgi:hypothetical protein